MARKQLTFWDSERLQFDKAIDITIESINAYASRYQHWVIAWSGGKDSTTVVTLIVSLIESGQIPKPKTLTILLADTRMEFLPIWLAAMNIKAQLEKRKIDVRIVRSSLEDRFHVYMLGRGVPPPNNTTMRWCTSRIKISPMDKEIDKIYKEVGEKVLLFTGVRIGESAARDSRIALSCSRNGSECGQGWFQEEISDEKADKLAPIIHWRVCTVWDWLRLFAPTKRYGKWETEMLAIAYGGEEATENNARTGCNGCPLVEEDTAIDGVLKNYPEWEYLRPLKRIRAVYRALRLPSNRLRHTEIQYKKDGSLGKNQNRMGPLTMEARAWGLNQLLKIQEEINIEARRLGKPEVDMLNEEEISCIKNKWAINEWPKGWTGSEPRADLPFIPYTPDGSVQLALD